jgi:hypothetical protein
VQGTFDEMALQAGDVLDAAVEDLSDMAGGVTSFVSSSLGLEDAEAEGASGKAPGRGEKKTKASPAGGSALSPRQRAESSKLVEDFCERYPAFRVAPNAEELEVFWASCSVLNPAPIASAIYEQLSWSGGELEWQPRLRVLYALEHLHKKGGAGKKISTLVFQQAGELIQCLTEVQQCKEKAEWVILVLQDKVQQNGDASRGDEGKTPVAKAKAHPNGAKVAAAAKAKAAAPATQDLLDFSAPASAATTPSPGAVKGDPIPDLLLPVMEDSVSKSAVPEDLNLIGDTVLGSAGPRDLKLLGAGPSTAGGSPFDPNMQTSTLGAQPLAGRGAAGGSLASGPSFACGLGHQARSHPANQQPSTTGILASAKVATSRNSGASRPGPLAGTALSSVEGYPSPGTASLDDLDPFAGAGLGGSPSQRVNPTAELLPKVPSLGAPMGARLPRPEQGGYVGLGVGTSAVSAQGGRGNQAKIPSPPEILPMKMAPERDPFAFVAEHTSKLSEEK